VENDVDALKIDKTLHHIEPGADWQRQRKSRQLALEHKGHDTRQKSRLVQTEGMLIMKEQRGQYEGSGYRADRPRMRKTTTKILMGGHKCRARLKGRRGCGNWRGGLHCSLDSAPIGTGFL